MPLFSLHNSDCLAHLRTLEDCSIDSIVTDPPYGISFMGKKWDYDVPSVDIWKECLRVLKPGGHLLAFAGTRTQHRMCVNIEDAGFEIRDIIAWCYASGFPKSHNLKDEWEGWGTALKPALEPITVARKPFKGTVASNMQTHSTGALNINGCRVATDDNLNGGAYAINGLERTDDWGANNSFRRNQGLEYVQPSGRWPANLIHDGSDEVVGLFPHTGSGNNKGVYCYAGKEYANKNTSMFNGDKPQAPSNFNDHGSAARFFYCAKANKRERGEGNNHPTVKPITLMAYLCRLVTPPGGIVLDPFMGSGSTGIAALQEGFGFIGIERELEYVKIAESRIKKRLEEP